MEKDLFSAEKNWPELDKALRRFHASAGSIQVATQEKTRLVTNRLSPRNRKRKSLNQSLRECIQVLMLAAVLASFTTFVFLHPQWYYLFVCEVVWLFIGFWLWISNTGYKEI